MGAYYVFSSSEKDETLYFKGVFEDIDEALNTRASYLSVAQKDAMPATVLLTSGFSVVPDNLYRVKDVKNSLKLSKYYPVNFVERLVINDPCATAGELDGANPVLGKTIFENSGLLGRYYNFAFVPGNFK